MSMYGFTGTLKEIVSLPTNKKLKFIPDQECSVVVKSGKDETRFVVFLPVDNNGVLFTNDEGIAFKYSDTVSIEVKPVGAWLPTWKINTRYVFVLETVDDANHEVVVIDAPTSKYFSIESVTEKV